MWLLLALLTAGLGSLIRTFIWPMNTVKMGEIICNYNIHKNTSKRHDDLSDILSCFCPHNRNSKRARMRMDAVFRDVPLREKMVFVKLTCCGKHRLQCSLNCSVTLTQTVGVDTSWIKTGSKRFWHLPRKCWAYFARIPVRRHSHFWTLTRSAWGQDCDSHLRDIIKTTAFEPDLAFLQQSKSQYHPSH